MIPTAISKKGPFYSSIEIHARAKFARCEGRFDGQQSLADQMCSGLSLTLKQASAKN